MRLRCTVIALLIPTLVLANPAPLAAQAGTARVTYRTREVAFVSAGRDSGLAVGDTLDVLAGDGTVLTRGVVVSAARRTASVRLLAPDADVREGQRVRYVPHPPAPAAAAADSVLAAADTGIATDTVRAPVTARAPDWTRRRSGGIYLEQYAQSAGSGGAIRTQQTVLALDLTTPLARAVAFDLRLTNRWRSGASRSLVGQDAFTAVLYQAELRVEPPGGRWSVSVGRFIPRTAMGLGYLDGLRADVRVAGRHRLGFAGGLVPDPVRLRPTGRTRRLGAYWAFDAGTAFEGSLSAAADWRDGRRYRTEVAGQASWRPLPALGVSAYGEVDLPVSGGLVWQRQLTAFHASLWASLPAGVRASLGFQAARPLPLFDPSLPADTTPPPGRLDGFNASLGRSFGPLSLDLGGALLRREGDPRSTRRGSLNASLGFLSTVLVVQSGVLLDYRSALVRFMVPARALPFTLSIAGSASSTSTAGGALTLHRSSVRPEIAWRLGGGLLLTAGGDIGRYAGSTTTWLHAGVSYRFR